MPTDPQPSAHGSEPATGDPEPTTPHPAGSAYDDPADGADAPAADPGTHGSATDPAAGGADADHADTDLAETGSPDETDPGATDRPAEPDGDESGADAGLAVLAGDPDGPDGDDRGPRRSRRRTVLLAALGALGVTAAVGVGAAAYYASRLQQSMSQIQRASDVMPGQSRPPSAVATADTVHAPLNVAVMGTDSRGPGDRGRSDSLMVLHVAGDRRRAYFVSFPRDMWVEIPGHGKGKINAAYAWGGPALSVQVLEQVTGTRIDHVALTNFDNFTRLVDVVGGVTVHNAHAGTIKTETGTYTFPEGEVTLDGASALAYCRERFDLPNGDFDRASRQRDVLKALLAKAASPEVLANPAKVNDLIASVGQYVTVDEGLTNARIIEYATQVRITSKDSILTLQAPLAGASSTPSGEWIAVPDQAGVALLGEALRNDTMAAYYAEHRYDHTKPLPRVPYPR